MRRQHGLSRQRRGVVGCTNLASVAHVCAAGADARQPRRTQPHRVAARSVDVSALPDVAAGVATAPGLSTAKSQLAHAKRDKFKLPLLATSTSGGQSGPPRRLSLGDAQLSGPSEAEHQLGAAIEAYEASHKSFKNEHWYTSPVGLGSKRSVLLAALKARDPGGSGLISCQELVAALQAPNLGLQELQARALLAAFVPQPHADDATLDYRSFVKQLHLPDDRGDQPGQDPIVFRQQSYVHRVRAHAAQLLHKVAAAPAEAAPDRPTAPSCVLPPLVHGQQSGEPRADDVDRLSFEQDKQRMQQRAAAKTRLLLAHMQRLDAFSRRQQQAQEQHESMRLAAKALHRHAHFERAFQEENRRLRVEQKQGKGLVRSPTTRRHRNASADSMFYVEPLHCVT